MKRFVKMKVKNKKALKTELNLPKYSKVVVKRNVPNKTPRNNNAPLANSF
jgi:hypothetical protein